jgi:molybdopterin/thiamine biosynthesis adenylyltransferase
MRIVDPGPESVADGNCVYPAARGQVGRGSDTRFDYHAAFSRTIGWVTPAELERLRQARVAIAGMGGVGGVHLLTLTRLGIGRFHLADFDCFDVHNFNRQAGAFLSTVGQPKVDVMVRMARDINPELDIRTFSKGVTPDNVDDFLHGVDVYVDGLDLFALEARRMVFAACQARHIPALTAAPMGMGVAMLYFRPGGTSFEEYFRLDGCDPQEQLVRLVAGLSPALLQRRSLMVPEAVNFLQRRGPSTPMGCELCAGVLGTAVLKVLLQRGPLRAVPWGMHFDAYRQKLSFTWRPGGNRNPLQRLLLTFLRSRLRG